MNKEQRKQAVKMFEPEAMMAIEQSKKDITHKNGYTAILFIVSDMPKIYQDIFIDAMVENGYPFNTANQVKEILGLI